MNRCLFSLFFLSFGFFFIFHSEARIQRVCSLRPLSLSWFEKARLATNTKLLVRAFRKQKYRPPARSFLLAARLVPGIGQPAMVYYGLRNTGFVRSPGRFWPASTVKLWAAVGALMRLRKHRLDATAVLQFSDGAGFFRGSLGQLMGPMSNVDYDRLLRVASTELLNHRFRRKMGYPHLILKRGYGGTGRISRTPRIKYFHAGRTGSLPSIRASSASPCRKNCMTLFEIQDVLRRVVLHRQLPQSERFPISDRDAKSLSQALAKQWKWAKDATYRVLGSDAVIYNKAGSVPGNHLLDNSVILSTRGNFLLSLASPWPRRQASVAPALREFNELARQSLMLLQHTSKGPPLQRNAGPFMSISLQMIRKGRRHRHKRLYRIIVKSRTSTGMKLWMGHRRLRNIRRKGSFWTGFVTLRGGSRLVVAQGYRNGQLHSYKSLGFRLPARYQRIRCR